MSNNIKVKRILLISILLVISVMVVLIVFKKGQEGSDTQRIKVLPNFKFNSLDNHLFTKDSIAPNKKTIIMLYSSDCFHCYSTFDQIINVLPEIDLVQLLMVSSDSLKTINDFRDKFDLDSSMPIEFFQCDEKELINVFGEFKYPTLYCYNQNKHLIKRLAGNIDVEKLSELINSGNKGNEIHY